MRNTYRFQLIATCFLLLAMMLGGNPMQGQALDNPEVQAFMVAFYTKRLRLSPDEAKGFWPVHDAFSKEHRAAQKASRKKLAEIMNGTLSLSDDELEQLGDDFLSLKQNEYDIVKQYHEKFKQVLPIRKVLLLYKVEQDYKKALLEEIRRRRQERMKQGRKRR